MRAAGYIRVSADEQAREGVSAMHRDGMAYAAIARALNEAGVAGKRGGRFHASTIRYLLRKPLHATPVGTGQA